MVFNDFEGGVPRVSSVTPKTVRINHEAVIKISFEIFYVNPFRIFNVFIHFIPRMNDLIDGLVLRSIHTIQNANTEATVPDIRLGNNYTSIL